MSIKKTQTFLFVLVFFLFSFAQSGLAQTAPPSNYSGPCVDVSGDLYPGLGGLRNPVYKDEVKTLQSFLVATGFMPAYLTGYYGPLTENGVTAFQRKYGLAPQWTRYGAATPATRAKIKELTCLNKIPPPLTLPAPVVTLSVSPSQIIVGQSTTLTWSSTNTTDCTASGAWSGVKSTSGSELVAPTQSSTYTLNCTGAGGSTSASASITAGVSQPSSIRVDIKANGSDGPITLSPGKNLEISWYATKAQYCVLSPNISVGPGVSSTQVSLVGSVILGPGVFHYPTASRAYTLECYSGPRSAVDSVIVNVSPGKQSLRGRLNLAAILETFGQFLLRLQDLIR